MSYEAAESIEDALLRMARVNCNLLLPPRKKTRLIDGSFLYTFYIQFSSLLHLLL